METQKITPNLWFDNQAEEAAKFYTSVFENTTIGAKTYYNKSGQEIHQQPEGKLMTLNFSIEDHQFIGLNGGPIFQFNPSISFFIICKTETEAERYWQKLNKNGEVLMPLDAYPWSPKYGWLQDQYGISWQIMLEKPSYTTQKIVPLFFFTGKHHGKAEEAIQFYMTVFKNTKSHGVLKYTDEDNNPYANGKVKHAQFELEGQTFMVMDSGIENDFPFTEAISMIIDCQTQEEIDYYWGKLGENGDPKAQQCGWLKDKFGVSWQICPNNLLTEMLTHPDKEKVMRVTDAFMQMKKMDIRKLKEAFES